MPTFSGAARRRTECVLAGVLLACLLGVWQPLDAATVGSWSVSTGEGFAAGTLDGVAVDEEGRVRLAPDLETLWGPAAGIVWDLDATDGGAVFVGISGPGRLLRLARDGAIETWYDGGEDALVTAVAAAGRAGAWIGVAPSGEVLGIARPGQEPSGMATGSKFVWALSGAADGALWVGTGVPGRVLRTADDGTLETVFETGDDPVRCLAPLTGGGVVAGTGGRGRVLRIAPPARPYVLFDADEPEIVAVAVTEDGTVFALAAGGGKQIRGARTAAIPTERTADNSVSVVATPPPGGPEPDENGDDEEPEPQAEPEPRRPTRELVSRVGGALYRIRPDGSVRRLWETASEMPFDLALTADGRVLIATGDAGLIHQVDFEGRAARLLRVASNQASALSVGERGEIWIGATGDARVARLGPGTRASGSYVGPAIDAGSQAQWGRVRWDADVPQGSALSFSVRAGNSAEPDETWTDWSALAADGSATPAGIPPARWLQLRADFAAAGAGSPLLRRVELSYLPRNRAPQLTQPMTETPGVVWTPAPVQSSSRSGPVVADDPVARRAGQSLQRAGSGRLPIRKVYERGARTVTWSAEDPDEDRLRYRLELRREGSSDWLPLARELADEFYSWDARSLPDGDYRVRVTASDVLDNPEGEQLEDQRVSEAFTIDNTRPTLGGLSVRRTKAGIEVEFVATDGGTIAACEVKINGGDWLLVEPQDGVADSGEERYRVRLDPAAGARDGVLSLMVRVSDAVGNLGGELWRID